MFTIASWSPPFDATTLGSFIAPESVTASAGEILLARLKMEEDGATEAASRIPALVTGVRQRHPGSPVVLWLPGAPAQVVIDVVRAASTMQVRGILGGDVPDPHLLRTQLTDPAGLSAFILRWGVDAGYLPQGIEHEDVRALLEAGPGVRTLNRLSRDCSVAARTLRSHLQRLGLPAPYAWLALAHGLRAALYIQRHAALPLEVLAGQLGSRAVANVNQQFRRVFGLSAWSVRRLLGCEPLLHAWFQRRLCTAQPARRVRVQAAKVEECLV